MHVRKLLNRWVSWTGYELGKVPDHPGRDYLADIRQLVGVPATLFRAVLLELNMAPMYEGQSRQGQVVDLLSDHGYRLVGIYHTHYHNHRFIKWCDGLFVTE